MIIHAATLSLVVHPATEVIPVRDPESAEGRALRDSIADAGILEPLKISKGRIVDGRERWLHAKVLGRETVPCIEIPESDVHATIFDSIICRKHMPKVALAYLAFPSVEALLAESKARRLSNLRNSSSALESSRVNDRGNVRTAEDYAERLGIGRTTFFQVRNVVGHFAKSPELKEYFEPKIFSGEMGLGAVLQGIAGWTATKGQHRQEREQLVLWQDKIKGFCDPRKFAGWDKTTPEVRDHVRSELVKGIQEAWPADLRESILEELFGSLTNRRAGGSRK